MEKEQERLIAALTAPLVHFEPLRALFLAGSLGRGGGDEFSDVDLVAVLDPALHEGFAVRWRGILGAVAPPVYWQEHRRGGLLINAIAADWQRIDLYMVGPDALGRRAKTTVRPLIDRDHIYRGLPEALPPSPQDPARVAGLIEEFLRVLGMMPVALGRGEHFIGIWGASILRDLLKALMLEAVAAQGKGGALHLSLVLPPAEMAVLCALPSPVAERQSVLEANLAIARAFLPRARALAARLELDWPEAFEAATRANLERRLGIAAEALG